MYRRFFVTIVASSKRELLKLSEYDFDLFRQTSKVTERQEFSIDGLLTLDQVGQLVEDGYSVTVRELAASKTPAQTEVSTFQEWLGTVKE